MRRKIIFLMCLFFFIPIVVYAKSDKVKLSNCIDGDTAKFILNQKEITVRFLAIDTPETKYSKNREEPFGEEASNYTCNILEKAKTIKLEYDNKSNKKDNYNRYLAWIWVDGKLLQKKIIQTGYAKVAYIYDDYKYVDLLKKEELKAKNKKIGIWSNSNTKSFNKSINIPMDYYSILISLIIILMLYLFFPKYRKKKYKKRV